MGGPAITPAKEVEVLDLYLTGQYGIKETARLCNIGNSSVQKILKRRGVPRRVDYPQRYRLRKITDTFFDVIDREDKAYWLGFIAADGAVDVAKWRLRIGLSVKDRDQLERFNRDLASDYPISVSTSTGFNRTHECARVDVTCKRLVQGLAQYGFDTDKTTALRWPDGIPEEHEAAFIRGYVDGDGGFTITKTDQQVRLQVISTMPFLVEMQHRLVRHCAVNYVKIVVPPRVKTSGLGWLTYGGNRQLARIARYLYDGATVYMPRKFEKVQHLL